MSNGTQPAHTAGWATSKKEHQHPRGMQTDTHTHTLPPVPFSHSQDTTHTEIHTQDASLLLFHMHAHTQPVKFQLNSTFNVLALSPLFTPFLFSLCCPICCAYLYVLYSCFHLLSESPILAKLVSKCCHCWIIIQQSSGSSEELYPSDAIEAQLKKPLCSPHWAEVGSLRRPDLKPVTLCQLSKLWLC